MIQIGKVNKLLVIKQVPFGYYLDGKDYGEILLPNKLASPDLKVNSLVDVFIYFDSEDQIIATTARAKATVGSFAYLKVIDINPVGAFLDWGLDKDLLVPGPEQFRPMQRDQSYIVYVTQDNQGRIVASSRLDHFLNESTTNLKSGDEVNLLIAETTTLGNKVIINDAYWGLIHALDIFQTLSYGKRITGYIKKIREDGKIDVVLRKTGQNSIQDLSQRILIKLQQHGGFLALHDQSSPQEIQSIFGDSKKSFKMAIGALYKKKEISIEMSGIRLLINRSS